MYGDFFSFYLCDVVLKLNGKGGQPVYVKVAGQVIGAVRTEMRSFTERNPLVIGARRHRGGRRDSRCGAAIPEVFPFSVMARPTPPTSPTRGGCSPAPTWRYPGFRSGKVSDIELDGAQVLVRFTVDKNIRMGEATHAAIKTKSLLGTKMLDVVPRGVGQLTGSIPLSATVSPYQLPDALGDLANTISGLDTDQLSESLSTLSEAFADTPAELRNAVRGCRDSPRHSTSVIPSCATCWTTPRRPPAYLPSAAIRSSNLFETPMRFWSQLQTQSTAVQDDLDEHLCGLTSAEGVHR